MACFDGTITSSALGMDTNIRVLLPPSPEVRRPYPVVYLLHGLTGNYTTWARYTRAESYSNRLGFAVVMPDAGRSFYTDMAHGGKYFTYITEELPEICGRMFNINTCREHSFIAGLSMGGYGALKAALSLPERYRGAAAFSSVCDIGTKRMQDVLAAFDEGPALFGTGQEGQAAWEAGSLYGMLGSYKAWLAKNNKTLPLFITCGESDQLLEQNRRFMESLVRENIGHVYKEWPGAHDWGFWDKSLELALEYFAGL